MRNLALFFSGSLIWSVMVLVYQFKAVFDPPLTQEGNRERVALTCVCVVAEVLLLLYIFPREEMGSKALSYWVLYFF